MARLEPDAQRQATWTNAQLLKVGSGAAVVAQQLKVPAGILGAGNKPQAATPSRPVAVPVGVGPLVPVGTLQFGEAEGPQIFGAPAAGNPAAPVQQGCSPEEAAINAKEAIVRQALEALKAPDKPEERDLAEALRILNQGYANASPEVRKLILNVVSETVKKVTVALTDQTVTVIDKTGRRAHPQGRADDAIDRINQLVRGFDRDFAGVVVNEAMLVFRGFYQSCQSQIYSQLPDDSVFGGDGVAALAPLADQIAGSPEGDAAIAGFVAMKAWNGASMLHAMTSGSGKAYAAAYGPAMTARTGNPNFVRDSLAASSMAELRALQDSTAHHGDALGEHGAQMARIANDFALFPAARFKKAMDAYRKSMDADWQRKETALRNTIVRDGRYLLQHMTALNKIAQEAGLTAEMRDEWEAIANDPKATIAITAALENDPDLIKGDGLKDVAGLLATLKKEPGPTRKLAFLTLRMTNVAATAFLQRTALEKLNGLKPGDPAAAAKITEALAGLRNNWFAKILGLNGADLDQAIAIVTKASAEYANNATLLEGGADPAEVARLNAIEKKEFDAEMNKLGTRVAAFNRTSRAGQIMRGLGVSMAIGLNFVSSFKAAWNDPDPVKIASTVDLGLLTAQRTSDFLVSLGVDPTSAVGRYAAAKLGDVPGIGRLVGKLAGVPIGEVYLQIFTVLEAVNAARSAFGWGVPQDTIQAGLSGASAVGFGLAFARAYGAAEWTGPWGIVIAAAAARGQMIYDEVKAAHQDEEKIEICLKAAGVKSDRSAGVLGEQMIYQSSVRGHSQLPFLSKIALFENLDLVDWINRLDQDGVDQLSDLVKIELNNGQETPSQYRPQPVSPDVLAQDETSTMKEFERQLILHKLI